MFDMKTIVFSYLITNVLITWFIALLWIQNRKRYAGLAFWLVDFILQAAGLLLLSLRGVAPDWISIVIAQGLIAVGILCLFIGLERFLGKPGTQIHNHLIVGGYVGLIAYFTFIQPDIDIRTILISAITILLTVQCAWLLLFRAAPDLRPITRATGVVLLLYALAAFIRIIGLIQEPLAASTGLFESPTVQVMFVFINQLLCIALTFTLIMMVTRRLEQDVREQAVKRLYGEQEIERLASFPRLNPNPLFEFDASGAVIYQNDAAITLRDQAKFDLRLFLPPDFPAILGVLAQEQSTVFSRQVQVGGKVFELSIQLVPEFNVARIYAVDITERKQSEEALRLSEEQFRSLFDRMMDGVYRSTHAGRFVDVNPAMVKMFGYSSRQEMLKLDIKKELYFAPEERGSHLLDTGQEEMDVYRMRRKDGSEIWVEDHGYYVHDPQGGILYHEGMLRDITSRRQAEESLRRSLQDIAHGQQTLHTLSLAAQAAQRAHTPQAIYQAVGDEVKKLGFDLVIFDFDSNKREMNIAYMTYAKEMVRAAETLVGFSAKTYRIPLIVDGHYDQVLSAGKAVLYRDAPAVTAETLHPLVRPFTRQITKLLGIRQGIYAALMVGGKPRGIMIVSGSELEEDDLPAVDILAAQISIALENAQLYQSIQQELSERKKAEAALQDSEAHYRAVTQTAHDAIISADNMGDIIGWNQGAQRIFGYTEAEAIGQALTLLVPGQFGAGHLAGLQRFQTGGEPHIIGKTVELSGLRKDGSEFPLEITLSDWQIAEDKFFTGIIRDISERKQLEEKLKELSLHNAMTGLYNRRFFDEEMTRLALGRQFPISIIMADVNGLKKINDSEGHTAGDVLLQRVAQVLQAAFRGADIIARIGGDEFAVLLPDTDAAAAEQSLRRLRLTLDKHNAAHDGTPLSIAFGVSTAQPGGVLADTLKEADLRMYADKNGSTMNIAQTKNEMMV